MICGEWMNVEHCEDGDWRLMDTLPEKDWMNACQAWSVSSGMRVRALTILSSGMRVRVRVRGLDHVLGLDPDSQLLAMIANAL
jgi:hypothetical protein